MATYSQELEDALKNMSDATENVLTLCNNLRANFKEVIRQGVNFRNYGHDAIKLFEHISDLERAALFVIGGTEVIRKQNADLLTTED